MGRRRHHPPLRILLNNRLVGHLTKAPSGAVTFRYAQSWLGWAHTLPASLSLPLREDPYHGEPVLAVLDNLLPDAEALRRRVAEKVGAAGTDAHSLLAAIGSDCVGALQFVPEDDDHHPHDHRGDPSAIAGEALDDEAVEQLLDGLVQTPLGLDRDDPFRITPSPARRKKPPCCGTRAGGTSPMAQRRPPISSRRRSVDCPMASIYRIAWKTNTTA